MSLPSRWNRFLTRESIRLVYSGKFASMSARQSAERTVSDILHNHLTPPPPIWTVASYDTILEVMASVLHVQQIRDLPVYHQLLNTLASAKVTTVQDFDETHYYRMTFDAVDMDAICGVMSLLHDLIETKSLYALPRAVYRAFNALDMTVTHNSLRFVVEPVDISVQQIPGTLSLAETNAMFHRYIKQPIDFTPVLCSYDGIIIHRTST